MSIGTPLWRNGPPAKPVLCNACGSRWRTKGSLANYIPQHAREALDFDEIKGPNIRSVTFKSNEQKLQKTIQRKCKLENESDIQHCDQNFCKFEGDTSNRSSFGSAISGSDSCLYFGTDDCQQYISLLKFSFILTATILEVEFTIQRLHTIGPMTIYEEVNRETAVSHDEGEYYSASPRADNSS